MSTETYIPTVVHLGIALSQTVSMILDGPGFNMSWVIEHVGSASKDAIGLLAVKKTSLPMFKRYIPNLPHPMCLQHSNIQLKGVQTSQIKGSALFAMKA